MPLPAFRNPPRCRKIAAENRIENNHGDQIAQHPEAARDGEFSKNRHGCHKQNREADGVGNNGDTAGHHQARRRLDGRFLFAAVALELLEESFPELDGMTDGARRDEKWHDQDEGLKVVAQQRRESRPPNKRDESGEHRDYDAVEIPIVKSQKRENTQGGQRDDYGDVF